MYTSTPHEIRADMLNQSTMTGPTHFVDNWIQEQLRDQTTLPGSSGITIAAAQGPFGQ